MSWSVGLSRFMHGSPRCEELPWSPIARSPSEITAAQRHADALTVRYVFVLIWPQADIRCHPGEAGCRVDVWQGGLRHSVQVPWGLVEFDRGLMLVRAVFQAGMPVALQRAECGLSLSLSL